MYDEQLTTCRVCGNTEAIFQQKGVLLSDIVVRYFECPSCGYIQTESPHWLDRAYATAINDSDTGIMSRNLANARIVLATMMKLKILEGKIVDCAGGYGILVRLLRDYGIDALWSDPYCTNLLARGFEHTNESADLVTSFEALEHFVYPVDEIDKMLAIAPNVLFSTEIIPEPAPMQDSWWYYGKEHGQHIGFFRIRTLEKIAKDRGKYLLSDGRSYHLITEQKISPRFWRILVRLNKIAPLLLQRSLVSKTWSDHLLHAQKLNKVP